jgi:hypothetical protein
MNALQINSSFIINQSPSFMISFPRDTLQCAYEFYADRMDSLQPIVLNPIIPPFTSTTSNWSKTANLAVLSFL